MKTEQQQLNDMYERVGQVFPMEMLNSLAPQQRTLTDNAINRVLNKDGPEALTVDRLEGIKELVTQHLWSSARTEASKDTPASAAKESEAPPLGNGQPHAGDLQGSGLRQKPEPMPPTRRRNCLILNLPD